MLAPLVHSPGDESNVVSYRVWFSYLHVLNRLSGAAALIIGNGWQPNTATTRRTAGGQ